MTLSGPQRTAAVIAAATVANLPLGTLYAFSGAAVMIAGAVNVVGVLVALGLPRRHARSAHGGRG